MFDKSLCDFWHITCKVLYHKISIRINIFIINKHIYISALQNLKIRPEIDVKFYFILLKNIISRYKNHWRKTAPFISLKMDFCCIITYKVHFNQNFNVFVIPSNYVVRVIITQTRIYLTLTVIGKISLIAHTQCRDKGVWLMINRRFLNTTICKTCIKFSRSNRTTISAETKNN